MGNQMVKEQKLFLMEKSMWENGRMVNFMAKESLTYLVERSM